ncbi:hypothetical protein EVAR_38639_1 [Eumeta japonica]|uniref:Uncharacterized protein n=1 Tax=Eumeta variegata TaxID=151549 RepID=A0A4C1XZ21_EUMVA|nr:hypothetical protein EVAR_38639_1 [Eumeta japonica]
MVKLSFGSLSKFNKLTASKLAPNAKKLLSIHENDSDPPLQMEFSIFQDLYSELLRIKPGSACEKCSSSAAARAHGTRPNNTFYTSPPHKSPRIHIYQQTNTGDDNMPTNIKILLDEKKSVCEKRKLHSAEPLSAPSNKALYGPSRRPT